MDRTKPLTDIERAIRGYMHGNDLGYEVNFFGLIEERGRTLESEQQLPFHSFLNIFEGRRDEIYTDYCHLTPLGNRLLARKLATIIEQRYPELFN